MTRGIFSCLQTLSMPVTAAAKGSATVQQSIPGALGVVQVDNHIAELTVRETLDFAARVLGVGHKEGAQLGQPLLESPATMCPWKPT